MALPIPTSGFGPANYPDGKQPDFPVPYTKFLCTVGPATESEEVLSKLVASGVTLFRLNFSHGTLEDQQRRLDILRSLDAKAFSPIAVLGDLCGPKIRCGKTTDEGIMLTEGQDVLIRADIEDCTDGEVPVLAASYAQVVDEPEIGHRVLINDGAIRMIAIERSAEGLRCRVTRGGKVTSRKGINLPDTNLSVPAVTDYDWNCVEWAVKNKLDFLALSFVRSAEDLRLLNGRVASLCADGSCGNGLTIYKDKPGIPVVAKIETPQGVDNIEEIVSECDGIMVARGDLGVELDLAKVPMVQKKLIEVAHNHGKPAIVATQMLESMIQNAVATRAEVSDVANAILDDADCLMLSGETAVGSFPAEAADTLRQVAVATEAVIAETPREPKPPKVLRNLRRKIPAIAHAAWTLAQDADAKAVAIWSQRGGEARYLSRHSFGVPIVAFTSDPRAVRRMNLLSGVLPVYCAEPPTGRTGYAALVDAMVIKHGWVNEGDPIVILAGKPIDEPGSVNTMSIRYAGELTNSPEFEHLQETIADGLPT